VIRVLANPWTASVSRGSPVDDWLVACVDAWVDATVACGWGADAVAALPGAVPEPVVAESSVAGEVDAVASAAVDAVWVDVGEEPAAAVAASPVAGAVWSAEAVGVTEDGSAEPGPAVWVAPGVAALPVGSPGSTDPTPGVALDGSAPTPPAVRPGAGPVASVTAVGRVSWSGPVSCEGVVGTVALASRVGAGGGAGAIVPPAVCATKPGLGADET
jgi:hypothetical protein